MKFIKLKEQLVSIDSIVKVDKPRPTSGIEWYIRTLLDNTKTQECFITSQYNSKEEADNAYNRIVEQLCADK